MVFQVNRWDRARDKFVWWTDKRQRRWGIPQPLTDQMSALVPRTPEKQLPHVTMGAKYQVLSTQGVQIAITDGWCNSRLLHIAIQMVGADSNNGWLVGAIVVVAHSHTDGWLVQ